MDSTHISGKQLLFAYCITDGVLDEMSEEQQSSIISIIESLLSEGEDAISESLLSRAKLQLVRVCCREKMQIRSNQSLSDMTAKNKRFK